MIFFPSFYEIDSFYQNTDFDKIYTLENKSNELHQ